MYPCLNVDEYNQILELKLKNPGKENVIEAIEILEENPIVLSVEVVLPDIIIEDFGEETVDLAAPGTDLKILYGAEVYKTRISILAKTDANLVLSHASASSTLSDEAQIAGDVNDDSVLTAQDALMILQYAARTLDSF